MTKTGRAVPRVLCMGAEQCLRHNLLVHTVALGAVHLGRSDLEAWLAPAQWHAASLGPQPRAQPEAQWAGVLFGT